MKKHIKIHHIFLVLLNLILVSGMFQDLYAQKAKKNKIRLKADYVKMMEGKIYLNISAGAKIKKQNIKVSNIDLTVYNEIDDKKIKLGTVVTDFKGESRFTIKDINILKPDSLNIYNLVVSFKGNDLFKRATKRVSVKDAEILANLFIKDSINYIKATLIDKGKDSVIIGESLNVQVQRLITPLKIGKEFNYTDDDGTIIVPIEEGIPGVDGILTIEVVLNDSDDYGTVKALVKAPIGTPIVDESTFDQRTMWSPRNKTPIFILIFTNILIFGVWGIFVYLIVNLYKIKKEGKNIVREI